MEYPTIRLEQTSFTRTGLLLREVRQPQLVDVGGRGRPLHTVVVHRWTRLPAQAALANVDQSRWWDHRRQIPRYVAGRLASRSSSAMNR